MEGVPDLHCVEGGIPDGACALSGRERNSGFNGAVSVVLLMVVGD